MSSRRCDERWGRADPAEPPILAMLFRGAHLPFPPDYRQVRRLDYPCYTAPFLTDIPLLDRQESRLILSIIQALFDVIIMTVSDDDRT